MSDPMARSEVVALLTYTGVEIVLFGQMSLSTTTPFSLYGRRQACDRRAQANAWLVGTTEWAGGALLEGPYDECAA
jgi:hypothetical protein